MFYLKPRGLLSVQFSGSCLASLFTVGMRVLWHVHPSLLLVPHCEGPQTETRQEPGTCVSSVTSHSATGWKRVRPGEAEALRRAGESSLQGGSLSCDGIKRLGYSDEAMYIGHREGKNIRPIKSWLRMHRTCVGAGGSLSLVVGEVQNRIKVR